jgi:hypothetical protein
MPISADQNKRATTKTLEIEPPWQGTPEPTNELISASKQKINKNSPPSLLTVNQALDQKVGGRQS